MKVKMARHSGLPLKEEVAQEYRDKWRFYYDKVLEKYSPDMEKVQERLEKLSDIMNKRYNTIEEVELPKSRKAWKELMSEYGGYAVCVATDLEGKDLRFILLDQGL